MDCVICLKPDIDQSVELDINGSASEVTDGTINIHKNIVARLSKEAFERIENRVADYCGEEASY
jgi:hypothetical protein